MTQARCLSALELAAAVRGTLSVEAAGHVPGCHSCAERVALLRRVEAVGVDRIAESADEAETLVARLTVMPRNRWWQVLRRAEYQRPDVVQRLLALAREARLRDRKLATALVTAATLLADKLANDTPTMRDLRFEAWKLAAGLLREAGKYADSESALARAELAARTASDPTRAEALVLFYRALLFAEADVWRPDEAKALLDRVEPVFTQDQALGRALRTARASVLYRSGDFHASRAMFAELLAATPVTERESRLDTLSNVMFASVDLGDASDEARGRIRDLIDENLALGRTVQVARARWLMGKVHRLRGEYEESARLLAAAIDGIGDHDSAIRVGLDWLETLLLAERYAEAASLARELAAQAVLLDQREPSRRRSLTAEVFAYAREASQRGALTADLVSELSRYLDRINRQRPTTFIPPMPLADM